MPSQRIEEVRQQMDHFEALLNIAERSERTPLFRQWVTLQTRIRQPRILEPPARNEAMAKEKTAKTTEKNRKVRLAIFRETLRVLPLQQKTLKRMQAEVERLQII
jgi:hypothetical protein